MTHNFKSSFAKQQQQQQQQQQVLKPQTITMVSLHPMPTLSKSCMIWTLMLKPAEVENEEAEAIRWFTPSTDTAS